MKKNQASLATAFLKREGQEQFKESFEMTKPSQMSGFRGLFGEGELTEREQRELQHLLYENFQPGFLKEEQVTRDYEDLRRITSEIKSISNQSILLHGERIKKAQELLKNYKEGAFTQWLLTTYGNRQTPYSMLQYYDFHKSLPSDMKPLIENLPKKAAYVLAAREGELERKLEILQNYRGEKQSEVLSLIQERFPKEGRAARSPGKILIGQLEKLTEEFERLNFDFTSSQREGFHHLLQRLAALI